MFSLCANYYRSESAKEAKRKWEQECSHFNPAILPLAYKDENGQKKFGEKDAL